MLKEVGSFFRTLYWVAITFAIALFSYANWEPVEVTLWFGDVPDIDTRLSIVAFVAFLFGLLAGLPLWISSLLGRWSLTRQLKNTEQQLADLRAMARRVSPPFSSDGDLYNPSADSNATDSTNSTDSSAPSDTSASPKA